MDNGDSCLTAPCCARGSGNDLEDGGFPPMQINGTRPWRMSCGTTRKVTTINGGKGRQWGNGNGEFPCGHAAWKPDSGNTTTVRGCFPPMDNGDRQTLHGRQVSPGMRPTLLLTTDGLGEWAMENGGRCPPAASRARDPAGMTN